MKSNEAMVESITKTIEAIESGRSDEALTAFEEDAMWRCGDALPEAGYHEGKAAIGKLFGTVRERYRNQLHILKLTIAGVGDHVFAEYVRSGSSDPNAKGSEHVLAVFDVVVGKIREVREFVLRRS